MNVKVALSLFCLALVARLTNAAPQYIAFPQSPADELHNAITSLTYGLHYRLAQATQAAAAQTILALGPPPTYFQNVPILNEGFDLRVRPAPGSVIVTSGNGNRFAVAGIGNRPNGVSASAVAVSNSN